MQQGTYSVEIGEQSANAQYTVRCLDSSFDIWKTDIANVDTSILRICFVDAAFSHGRYKAWNLQLVHKLMGFGHDMMSDATSICEYDWVFGLVDKV